MAPGQATAVSVQETALKDFFARIVLYPDGRLNLQGLVKPDAAPAPPGQPATETQAAAADGSEAQIASAGPSAVVDIGPVSVVDGRVFFTDLLIEPNYSANLSQLTGKLGAFSSRLPPGGEPELAALELRGRTEQSASIEITGKLNPLAKPLALDISGKVDDLELPPFTPYSVKYAGHGIERGKLSMDVHYVVKPDGRITASNQLVLNQLSFGDKVEDAPRSLPVKLAVALLADRNGVIDLNLPISGSLDNPKFSIWDVLGKSIGNILAKVVTAPFTLLANALRGDGGGESLDAIPFPAGSATLTADGEQRLDKVANALVDRPALRLTIVGAANLEAERDAYRRQRLTEMLGAEKRGGAAASASTGERRALLQQALKRADLPLPSDASGKQKELTDSEIEALLLSQIEVDEQAVRRLAVRRAMAVRDYLAGSELPTSRLFLGAVKLVAPEDDAGKAGAGKTPAAPRLTASADGRWQPHAELNLDTR